MTEPKLIISIKWGTMYGPEYVNRLYAMCRRNTTGDLRFVCMTDDDTGIRDEVETLPLPELGCEIPSDVESLGKWRKLALWNDDLFGLEGVALYIDLDMVIVDSLDPYFEYGEPHKVYVARNWVKPIEKSAQTSIYRFQIGTDSYILNNLRKDPATISRKYKIDQYYITHAIRGGVNYWPGAWTKHFRLHCMGPWPMRYIRPPRLPRGARVISFPGKPKPEDAAIGRWSPEHPSDGRLANLRFALEQRKQGKGFFKHIKRFVLPTPWVAEHYKL